MAPVDEQRSAPVRGDGVSGIDETGKWRYDAPER